MRPATIRAIESIRVCARLNIQNARKAKAEGRERMVCYYVRIALQCRADANLLAITGR